MPMDPGNVTINAAGVASGTGYARDVYDKLEAGQDFQGLTGTQLQSAKQLLAALANTSSLLIMHVQTNSTVTTIDNGVTPTDPIAWAGTGVGGTVA